MEKSRLNYLLEKYTGFPHAAFVQSGSAALQLYLETHFDSPTKASIPAIACWTIAGTLHQERHEVHFRDPNGLVIEGGFNLGIIPWANAAALSEVVPADLVDLTVCLDPDFGQKSPFGIVSLGSGKPMDCGAGGLLLFQDEAFREKAHFHMFFGRLGLKWEAITQRYTFPSSLLQQLETRLEMIEADQQSYDQRWNEWREIWAALETLGIRLAASNKSNPGYSKLWVLELSEEFPLNAEEIYRVAFPEQVPLLIQPVLPAYEQAAWNGIPRGYCPHSEQYARRMLFFPSHLPPEKQIQEKLKNFIEGLLKNPTKYHFPYHHSKGTAKFPQKYRHWIKSGILGRNLKGDYYVLDQRNGKLYQVNEAIAGTILSHSKISTKAYEN